MPALPDLASTVGYAAAPVPMQDAGALSRPSDVLAAGMRDVSSTFAQISGRLEAAQQVSDAAGFQTQAAMHAVDLRRKYAQDPDPASVPARFNAEIADYQKTLLGGIPDAGTRFHVERYLTHAVPTLYAEVMGDASQRQTKKLLGDQAVTLNNQTNLLASAGNEADHQLAVQGIYSTLKGNVASGLISQNDANQLFSQSMRNAVVIKSATDPAAAKALLDRYRPEMQAGDIAALEMHLQQPLLRQAGEGAAALTPQIAAASAAQAKATVDALPPDALARAKAIHDGMVARGYDSDTGWAIAGNGMAESGGNPGVAPGDGGISHGLMQWNKERLDAYRAQYGHNPEDGNLDENLDFIDHELKITHAGAAARIAAAQGPGDKAAAVSRYYLIPDDKTGQKAADRSALARQLAGDPTAPGLPAQMDIVHGLTADAPYPVQLHAESLVREKFNLDQAGRAPLIADVRQKASDLATAYDNGMTDAPIPEDRIRAVLPPDEANRTIEHLRIGRAAGDMLKSVASASPAEEQQMLQALAVPGAVASMTPRKDGHVVLPAPGAAASGPESSDGLSYRLAVARRVAQQIDAKHQAIAADSAGYAAGLPDAQARARAIDPNDPAQVRGLIQANMALQAHIGVAVPRALTNAQVSDWVQRIHGTDPANGDAGLIMQGMAQQFGDDDAGKALWRQAFGELVEHGKLSADYKVLGSLTGDDQRNPSQAGARADLQRALALRTQKGGMEQLVKDAPRAESKKIDDGIADTMSDFRASTANSQGGLDLFNTMQDAVRTLAHYYAYQGQDGGTALKNAYARLLGDRYDFDHGLRVPKGMLAPVRGAAFGVQRDLTAADIAVPPARETVPGETAEQRGEAMLTAAKAGFWINNADGGGAILMARLHNGQAVVRRPDGSPVQILFDHLPSTGRWPGGSARPGIPDLPSLGIEGTGLPPAVDPVPPIVVPSGAPSRYGPVTQLPSLPVGPDLSHVTNRPVGDALFGRNR